MLFFKLGHRISTLVLIYNRMVKRTTTRRRENYIKQCDKFTNFIYDKNIILTDKEFLNFKQFLWKKKCLKQSKNIVEILFGYLISDFKHKTLIVCDHVTSKIITHKAKEILNHKCDIDSCLEVVSNHELHSNLNLYHQYDWNRVVVFGSCEYVPPGENFVFVTKEANHQ